MKHAIKLIGLLFCLGVVINLGAQEEEVRKVIIVKNIKCDKADVDVNVEQCVKIKVESGMVRAEQDVDADNNFEITVEVENDTKHIKIAYSDENGERQELEWEGEGEPPAFIQQYLHKEPSRMHFRDHHNTFIFIVNKQDEEEEVQEVRIDVIVEEPAADENEFFFAEEEEPQLQELEEQVALPASLQKGQDLELSSLEFYPVPTSTTLQLRFSAPERTPVQVSVLDVQGRAIYQEDVKNFLGDYANEIDLSGNAPGTYFLSIRQGDKMHTERILLQ